jgi:anti-anti-sigma factor
MSPGMAVRRGLACTGHRAGEKRPVARTMPMADYELRGEIDLATAPQLRTDLEAAIASDESHLLIDCTHLTFIDSTGIAVLLAANRNLQDTGRHLLIVNVGPQPRQAFEVLGLADLLRSDGELAQ